MWDSLLRSALSFLLLLVAARWIVRRRLGKFGIFELFAVNAIGDLGAHLAFETQHPLMTGVTAVIFWVGALAVMEWLLARWDWLRQTLYRQPERLLQNGQADPAALSRARMSLEELQSELRKQGVRSLGQAQEVTLEPEGSLSVVKTESVKDELKRLGAALNQLADRLPASKAP